MIKEQELPEQNFYLRWVMANREMIKFSGVERHAGIPYQTFRRYLETGKFPPRHLKRLEERMTSIISPEMSFCLLYVDNLISQRQILMLEMGSWVLGSPAQLVASAKQELILDNLVTLYCMATEKFPHLQELLQSLIEPVVGSSFQEICQALRAREGLLRKGRGKK